MKLVWVVPGGVDRSGTERVIPFLLWQIERLASRHEMHVIALRQEPRPSCFPLLGATVHNLGGSSSGQRRAALAATMATIGGGIEAVHAWWAGETSVIARRVARRDRLPYLVSVTGGEVACLPQIGYGSARGPLRRLRVRRELGLAGALTCQTAFAAGLIAGLGYSAEVVPVGVPPARFEPGEMLPDGPPWRLLQVASLNRVKDQGTLLRGLARLLSNGWDVQLEIIGIDTLNGAMARLAAELGVAERVDFAGWRPIEQVAEAYRRSHLLIHTSLHEAGPLAVLEAAAAGLPTVGSRVGQVADWAPELAWSFDPGDANGLATTVAAALTDTQRRRQVAAAAREWTLAHDADWTAARFEALYAQLAQRGKAGV